MLLICVGTEDVFDCLGLQAVRGRKVAVVREQRAGEQTDPSELSLCFFPSS